MSEKAAASGSTENAPPESSSATTVDEAVETDPQTGPRPDAELAAAEPPPSETAVAADEPAMSEPAEDPAAPAALTATPVAPAEVTPDAAAGAAPAEQTAAEESAAAFFRRARIEKTVLQGRVIGWNRGGFHVVIHDVTTFCPRSEIEVRQPKSPTSYLDQTFDFLVLKVQDKGRRVVVSRAAVLSEHETEQVERALDQVAVGAVLEGSVSSIADFGAFVDLGGVRGLVHVSEISREQIAKPQDVLQVGQKVKVKVLRIQEEGKRISLSIKALEPDPWDDVKKRYPEGILVKGTVERTNRFGAFIRLEPGLTGLLPMSEMSIPRDASPARVFPPGKELTVQVISVDSRQKRISLGLEGTRIEGSKADFKAYLDRQKADSARPGFNALAAAFKKLD